MKTKIKPMAFIASPESAIVENVGLPTKPLNTQVAVSPASPNKLDYVQIVAEVAQRKSAMGISLRGGNALMSGVAAAVKSRIGLGREDQLPSDRMDSIENAIAAFWASQAQKVLTYGTVVATTFDKPSLVVGKDGEANKIRLNARLHAVKPAQEGKETGFFASGLLRIAGKRLERMEKNLGSYTVEQVTACKARIEMLTKLAGVTLEVLNGRPDKFDKK